MLSFVARLYRISLIGALIGACMGADPHPVPAVTAPADASTPRVAQPLIHGDGTAIKKGTDAVAQFRVAFHQRATRAGYWKSIREYEDTIRENPMTEICNAGIMKLRDPDYWTQAQPRTLSGEAMYVYKANEKSPALAPVYFYEYRLVLAPLVAEAVLADPVITARLHNEIKVSLFTLEDSGSLNSEKEMASQVGYLIAYNIGAATLRIVSDVLHQPIDPTWIESMTFEPTMLSASNDPVYQKFGRGYSQAEFDFFLSWSRAHPEAVLLGGPARRLLSDPFAHD